MLSRRFGWPAVAALILVGVLPRLQNIDAPQLGKHQMRFYDTAAMARNFYEEGMNPLYPRVDWRGAGSGFVESEFPAYAFSVAALYHVFGVHHWVGRALNIFFYTLTAGMLFLLSRRVFGDDRTAFLTVAFFCFAPLSVYYFRTVQPDPLAALSSIGAIYFFLRWTVSDGRLDLAISAGALALAVGIKPFNLYLGLPLAVLALSARGGSRVGRIRSAAGSNARRREEGDAVVSVTNVNEAVGHAPSEPIMQENTGREGVTAVGRCRSSESMRRIDSFLDSSPSGRKTLSCDPRDFHHGLLGKGGPRILLDRRMWAFAAVTLGLPALWLWHGYGLWADHGNTFGLLAGGLVKVGAAGFSLEVLPEVAEKLGRRLVTTITTPAGLILLVVGVWPLWRRGRLFVWWAVGFAVIVAAVWKGHTAHEYYQLPATLFVSACMAAGASNLMGDRRGVVRALGGVLSAGVVAWGLWHSSRMIEWEQHPRGLARVEFGQEVGRRTPSSAKPIFVVPLRRKEQLTPLRQVRAAKLSLSHREPDGLLTPAVPFELYDSHRKGWTLYAQQASPDIIQKIAGRGATHLGAFDPFVFEQNPELERWLEVNAKRIPLDSESRLYCLVPDTAACSLDVAE